VVPKAAFVCHRCGEEEAAGGSFHCVVCDGQILSVLQEHVVAMLRPSMNAARVDFAMTVACAVRHAAPRRVLRTRVRAKPTDASALTRAEAEVWPLFSAVADGMPPAPPSLPRLGPPRMATEKEASALWADSTVVNTFFKVHDVQPERADAAAAETAGGEDGAVLQDEEEDVVDVVNASDSENGDGGDERLDGRRCVGRLGRVRKTVLQTRTVASLHTSTGGCPRGCSRQLPPLLCCPMRPGCRRSSCRRPCSGFLFA